MERKSDLNTEFQTDFQRLCLVFEYFEVVVRNPSSVGSTNTNLFICN